MCLSSPLSPSISPCPILALIVDPRTIWHCIKLSVVSNCLWCQIVCGVKLSSNPYCHIYCVKHIFTSNDDKCSLFWGKQQCLELVLSQTCSLYLMFSPPPFKVGGEWYREMRHWLVDRRLFRVMLWRMFSSRQAVSRHRVSREITNGADTPRKSNRKHRQQIVFHICTLINTESSSNRKSDTEPEERENLAPEGKLGSWEPHPKLNPNK